MSNMPKLLFDTNFWIRFVSRDEPKKYQIVSEIIQKISDGQISAYISNIIILEINFVLVKKYHLPQKEVDSFLNSLLKIKGLKVIDKTDTKKALGLRKQYGIKLADCMIATQTSERVALVTFDRDFQKIKGLKMIAPESLV